MPSPSAPPVSVVPYRVLPLSVKPAAGSSPLLPLNEASSVGLPPLIGNAEDRAVVIHAAGIGRPIQGIAAERHTGIGVFADAVETGKGRQGLGVHLGRYRRQQQYAKPCYQPRYA